VNLYTLNISTHLPSSPSFSPPLQPLSIHLLSTPLHPSFFSQVGFGTGIEFRDSSFVLKKGSKKKVQRGMVFNVCVGFAGITLSAAEEKKRAASKVRERATLYFSILYK
jgi:hypothetical protein